MSMFNSRLIVVLLACLILSGCGALGPSRTVTTAPSCAENPYQCSNDRVCHFATIGSGAGKSWDNRYQKHVMVAQQRGLKCGVQTGSGNSSSQSADKLRSMSDEVICASATHRRKWETRETYLPHVKEAKRRGLTCNVTAQSALKTPRETREICKKTPAKCSNIELCHFATRWSGSKKVWDSQSPRHVTLAKQKGLDCGVQVEQKKLCKNEPKQCDAERLCFWATNGPVGNKSWHDAYASHVKEAKQRGLNCNVRSSSSSSSTTRAYNNEIPKIVDRAIKRLKRIGKLNSADVQRLIQKLKKMEPRKLKALNTKCTQAFENLQPSLCENQLTKLVR